MYEKGKWIWAIFDQKIMIIIIIMMMGFRIILMMGFRDSKKKISRARAGGGVTWLSPCERHYFIFLHLHTPISAVRSAVHRGRVCIAGVIGIVVQCRTRREHMK